MLFCDVESYWVGLLDALNSCLFDDDSHFDLIFERVESFWVSELYCSVESLSRFDFIFERVESFWVNLLRFLINGPVETLSRFDFVFERVESFWVDLLRCSIVALREGLLLFHESLSDFANSCHSSVDTRFLVERRGMLLPHPFDDMVVVAGIDSAVAAVI